MVTISVSVKNNFKGWIKKKILCAIIVILREKSFVSGTHIGAECIFAPVPIYLCVTLRSCVFSFYAKTSKKKLSVNRDRPIVTLSICQDHCNCDLNLQQN